MLQKNNNLNDLIYLWNERLIVIYPELFELEIFSELVIADGGLVEGQIIELVNQDFKIYVKIDKSLVSFTPTTYTDVTLEIYESV